MALNPHSEEPDLGAPPEYAHDHPAEHPEQWGWHGEWGRGSRIAGVVVAAILLLMITSTHYGDGWTAFLAFLAAAMVVTVFWDHHRRKNAWRK